MHSLSIIRRIYTSQHIQNLPREITSGTSNKLAKDVELIGESPDRRKLIDKKDKKKSRRER